MYSHNQRSRCGWYISSVNHTVSFQSEINDIRKGQFRNIISGSSWKKSSLYEFLRMPVTLVEERVNYLKIESLIWGEVPLKTYINIYRIKAIKVTKVLRKMVNSFRLVKKIDLLSDVSKCSWLPNMTYSFEVRVSMIRVAHFLNLNGNWTGHPKTNLK